MIVSADIPRNKNKAFFVAMLTVALLLGAFECLFGRVAYSADAINYLNIVRAIHAGDWKLALSSYWSLGYPLLLSAITPLFPSTPSGEWAAIHLVNLAIFAITFFSFNRLVAVAAHLSSLGKLWSDEQELLLTGTFAVFLSTELCLDNVSRIGPDMLVSCLLFAAAQLLLQLCEQPRGRHAILLGIVLGMGYVTKSIFLPLTLLFCLVAALLLWKKGGAMRSLALIAIGAGVFAAPYIAAVSWAQGRLTYGDAGPLNYAWSVDKVEPLGLWQGWPPGSGKPLHPAKLVLDSPHVYLFDGPFPATFNPFFNPPYYYQGLRIAFSWQAQVHAIGINLFRLIKLLRWQCLLYVLAICLALSMARSKESKPWRRVASDLLPVLLIAAGGTLIYLLVVVEARYMASFVAMFILVLFLAVVAENAVAKRSELRAWNSVLLAWVLAIACGLTLLANEKDSVRDVLGNAVHGRLFYNGDQWRAGLGMEQMGLGPGSKVAVMSDLVGASQSTWAYMDRLQIVGILGGSLDAAQTADYDAFWNSTPERQRQILWIFRDSGARAVVSISEPRGDGAPGWARVAGTEFWVYRF